jgi:hypothetical protein
MRTRHLPALTLLLLPGAAFATGRIALPNLTVGRNLQTIAAITLDDAAPPEGLAVKLTSSDPKRLLLSTSAEKAGAASITMTVRAGSRSSMEFFVQGLAATGTVSYTASATGFESAAGTVTLAPSGIVFARSGVPTAMLSTTTGAPADVGVHTALLDESLNYVAPQTLAGGAGLRVAILTSDPKVGGAADPKLTIAAGGTSAMTHFKPAGPGMTTLSIDPPPGFSTPAQFATLPTAVIVPGISITDGVAVGQNLQIEGSLSLGEPAPAGGIDVKLASADPAKLLLAGKADEPGRPTVTVHFAAGAVSTTYYIQGIGNQGVVATTATAPGYRERTGEITLAHSGVVIGGPPGPPDEAELFRKEAADAPHGFMASLSGGVKVPLLVFTVQLDPATGRAADLTVQPLRAGMSLTAILHNSNPAIGRVESTTLTIKGGQHTATTEFIPLSAGSTTISVDTPKGFKESANATNLTVIVK